jgi:antitoxin PrlF
MPYGKVTSKGQTTIPKEIRDHLELRAGDKLVYAISGDHVILRAKNKSIKSVKGLLYRPGQKAVSLKEMDDGIAEGAARFDRSGYKPPRPIRRSR